MTTFPMKNINHTDKQLSWVSYCLKGSICFLLCIYSLVGCAPTPIPENFSQYFNTSQPPPQKPASPIESLAAFESELVDDSNYHLGAGDEITVEVWGYPELSGKHIIGPDGKITIPLVGTLKLSDLSREIAAELITEALSSYYVDLATTVRVDRYASNRILVLGQVSKPGVVQFGMTSPTLLEAISLAGGFENIGGLTAAQSLPYTRCAVFRKRDKIIWVDLEPLLTGKDLSLNLRLQRNDVVYVPDIEERLVYVLGEVNKPGAFRLTPNMSFIEAIARAGGPTIDAAPSRINVIRPGKNINQSLSLEELIQPDNRLNVALQDGDIIYVPTNVIAKINYMVRFLTPFSTLLNIYADVESIRTDQDRRHLDEKERRLNVEEDKLDADRAAFEAEQERARGYE